jgi:hypothetical protein
MSAYPRNEDAHFTFLATAKRTADFFHGAKIMANGEWRVANEKGLTGKFQVRPFYQYEI